MMMTEYVECDAESVPEFVSVRSCETERYTNNSLLGRVLSMARRVVEQEELRGDHDGVLAQILRHNPLHMLSPDKLLLARRLLTAILSSDFSTAIDRLLHFLLDNKAENDL
ncbi:ORF181 [Xestia c-nigrum granulovirus]|uniref:ORF181 n=1 Tax=Xestia c-nigrum granulosis virus TaxID=51677 RepID=Q9PYL5_GVXN|nr:ORF181 [Xestia c-nigrum granulovirus]AAF05295.1 ORF181 [Xestia c-nigrum granulovirus]